MRTINLDASSWKTVLDFYHALLRALGAPEWHGESIDALSDSMIWGGINAVEPPYKVMISGTSALPATVREEIELTKQVLAEHRLEFQARKGKDTDVTLDMAP